MLLTTPEPADALPAGHARIFATSRAIVLDELHLLDGIPRGDQVRLGVTHGHTAPLARTHAGLCP